MEDIAKRVDCADGLQRPKHRPAIRRYCAMRVSKRLRTCDWNGRSRYTLRLHTRAKHPSIYILANWMGSTDHVRTTVHTSDWHCDERVKVRQCSAIRIHAAVQVIGIRPVSYSWSANSTGCGMLISMDGPRNALRPNCHVGKWCLLAGHDFLRTHVAATSIRRPSRRFSHLRCSSI